MFADDLLKVIEGLAKRIRALETNDNHNFLSSTSSVCLGNPETDGSWRIIRSGNNLVFERRETGAWVTKNTITP